MGVEDEFEEMRRLIDRMLQDAVTGSAYDRPAPHSEPPPPPRARAQTAPPHRFLVPVPPQPVPVDPEVALDTYNVYVTWDLPGPAPDAVHTRISGHLLLVELEGRRRLQRVVELPCGVEEEARWTYRNGVLDIILPRREHLEAA